MQELVRLHGVVRDVGGGGGLRGAGPVHGERAGRAPRQDGGETRRRQDLECRARPTRRTDQRNVRLQVLLRIPSAGIVVPLILFCYPPAMIMCLD